MEGSLEPMILPADLMIRCSLFLSCLVADPNHTERKEKNRLDYGGIEQDQQLRKYNLSWAFFLMELLKAHFRSQ